MNTFDTAAVLIALAAVLGYANFRWLRLPASIGILLIALVGSLLLVAADRLCPAWGIRTSVTGFLAGVDFTAALMHGTLCFLLFAGAIHVNWEELRRGGWVIGTLSTVGVLISTVLVGGLTWALFRVLGLGVPLAVCLVFGALISPTDPIAVLGLLKELRAPRDLEACIGGEALFNDGVGVVVFFACLGLAGLATHGTGAGAGSATTAMATLSAGSAAHSSVGEVGAWGTIGFLLQQVGGGMGLGLGLGYVAYRALKTIDHGPLELLITVAAVMFMYSVSFWIRVSGPIAVVVAGLLIGTAGRRDAMSPATVGLVEAFWGMLDEIFNAVLFLLVGLEVLTVHWSRTLIVASALAVPIVLLARFVSVGLPLGALQGRGGKRGVIPILTWGGLRGGLSLAMVLSLPPFEHRNLLVGATYAVVVFSVVVQGMTMRRLCGWYGLQIPGQ